MGLANSKHLATDQLATNQIFRLVDGPMTTGTQNSASFGYGNFAGWEHSAGWGQAPSARTALAAFHSVFLAPDQLDLSEPVNGFAGRWLDAANLSGYFAKSMRRLDRDLSDGSKKED